MVGEGDGRKVRKCVEATPELARDKEDTEWRSVARLSCTSCGPRYSHTLTPCPFATSPPPLATPFVLLILSSHFTTIAIALPGVGFQSNPRDPCGKVWLFNFLPRGVRQLSPSFFLFSHLSELLAFAILSTSLSPCRHSCYEAVHFFSARSDRSFQALYIVRCGV